MVDIPDAPPSSKKTRLTAKQRQLAAAALAVLIVAALVAALGGFNRRVDREIVVAPGVDIDVHAAAIRINSATVEHHVSDILGESWTIKIMGEILNVSDRQIKSTDLRDIVQFRYTNGEGADMAAPTVSMNVCQSLTSCGYSVRRVLPPTATFFPVRWQFLVYDGFTAHEADGKPASQGVVVGIWPMEYRNNTILGLSSEDEWAQEEGKDNYWTVRPPVEFIDR
ncbi:MAG: hypothetical protein LBN10_02700 [Propionibacteriaceae bacterium]|jgi:hypothetical protein|nr:hypothetical protein [Propionibacteriaceae bacterium]